MNYLVCWNCFDFLCNIQSCIFLKFRFCAHCTCTCSLYLWKSYTYTNGSLRLIHWSLVHWKLWGVKHVGGFGGLGQEFISPLIGPLMCFYWWKFLVLATATTTKIVPLMKKTADRFPHYIFVRKGWRRVTETCWRKHSLTKGFPANVFNFRLEKRPS